MPTYLPRRTENVCLHKNLYGNVYSSKIHNSQNVEITQHPSKPNIKQNEDNRRDHLEERTATPPVFLPEDPMDRGAWWASVHRVAKSRTRLKRLSLHRTMQLYSATKRREAPTLTIMWMNLENTMLSERSQTHGL